MKFTRVILGCLVSASLLFACGGPKKEKEEKKSQESKDATNTESDFIIKNSQACLMSIHVAKLGIKKASMSNIKELCKKIEVDQESLHSELKDLASAKNVTLQDTLSPTRARRLTALAEAKEEPELDKKILTMLGGEIRAIHKAFGEAGAMTDSDIKALIQEHSTNVKANLDSIRSIRRKEFPSVRVSKKPAPKKV
jgi:predicted outer membrane protein